MRWVTGAGLFFTLSVCISLCCPSIEAAEPSYGVTLLISALEQANNIRNYDVFVKYENHYVAKEEKHTRICPPWVKKSQFRQIFDRKTNRLLNVAWVVTEYSKEWGPAPEQFFPSFRLAFYDKDKSLERDHRFSRQRVRDEDFNTFLNRVSMHDEVKEFELAGIVGFPKRGQDRAYELSSAYARLLQRPPEEVNTQVLSDGTVVLRIESNVANANSSWTFDAQSQMPVKIHSLYEIEPGRGRELYVQCDIEFVKIDGFYLPHFISAINVCDPPVHLPDAKERVLVHGYSTATFEWKSVDVEKVEFPDVDALEFDTNKWAKFIGIDAKELPKKLKPE